MGYGGLTGALIGVMVAVIIGVPVVINVVYQTLDGGCATGTTRTILNFLPLLIAVVILVAVVALIR